VFSAFQSLDWGARGARLLPHVPHLQPLYEIGLRPPRGEVIMITGRSGSMKSKFAMWWAWIMGVPTLYFAADMSKATVGLRLAALEIGKPDWQIAKRLETDPAARAHLAERLAGLKMWFEYASPIRWDTLDAALDAYVSIWDAYPELIVLDNLMDIEGSSSEYGPQMEAMAAITELARAIDSTILVLHHATDKPQGQRRDPSLPPPRADIKGGMSEKPSLTLSVAFAKEEQQLRVAIIKQRDGACDPDASTWATLHADPDVGRFYSAPQVPGMSSTFNSDNTPI
jgi:hypothetical protein